MPYEPADHPSSKYWARVALLEAVREAQPEVLAELRASLPFFQQALPHLQNQHGQRLDLWRWDVMESTRPHASVLQLRWSITVWAQKHNLNFNWCLTSAFYSLVHWNTNAESFKYGWSYDGFGHVAPINDAERKLAFELQDGWRPDIEDQEDFTKRANAAFREALQAYSTRIVSLMGERKQVKTRHKYKPLVDDYSDFKLLALRLVSRLGYKEILQKVISAQKKKKVKKLATYKALESRIRRTAKLCEIDPKLLKQQMSH
jgi:hypothetical protein